jgi:hypothetical protein
MRNPPIQFVWMLVMVVALTAVSTAQERDTQSPASQVTGPAGPTNTGSNATDSGSKPVRATKDVGTPANKRRKPRTVAVIHSDQNKTVVPEGGAKEPPAQIAPGLAPEEAERDRHEAEQWLAATDGQLKELSNRHLSEPRQEVIAQVRNYQLGARSALKENDLRRAHTLALKAHLLADDMVKH